MDTCMLNELIVFSDNCVTLSNSGATPPLLRSGDPFRGGELFIHWQEKIATAVDIRLSFSEEVFVDCLKLRFSQDSQPESVCLYDKTKQQRLQCYSGETGKCIQEKEILLSANTRTAELILECSGDFSSIGLESIEVYGSRNRGLTLLPTPVESRFDGEYVPLSRFTTCSADCPEGLGAGEILAQELGIAAVSSGGAIRFSKDETVEHNGCRLEITGSGVLIRAADLTGFVYGAQTLLKLISGDSLPVCAIRDYPRMAFRGAHFYLPAREQLSFFKRLIRYLLSPMGYNCIFLEVGAGMEFASHPEINEAYIRTVEKANAGIYPEFPHSGVAGGKVLTKAEVADLVAYARRFGIDVIPEVQSLGHVQYMTNAHPEIAEIDADELTDAELTDTRVEDQRPEKFYRHCYCPSNEDSYRILFDILDEIIEVFQPREYVHMGHDEVYEIGVCPKCRQASPAALLASDINRIHAHLARKGLKMMMWADMLQSASAYKTPAAIDRIPKDIVLLDFIWYFHLDEDIEDNLLRKGFQVMFGNLYSSHFPRYESRIVKDGIIGALTSTWVASSEEALSREGKFYDLLLTAQMMWSESYSSHYRFSYDNVIRELMPRLRARVQDVVYPSTLPTARQVLLAEQAAGYPLTEVPDAAEFAVGRCCDSLIFEHNTVKKLARIPWIPLEEVGQYLVEYEDGETVSIPLTYGGNICHWNRRQNEPFPHSYYRHNGYCGTYHTDGIESRTPQGDPVCVYRYEWINPRKDIAIRRVLLRHSGNYGPVVFLHKLIGIR